MYLNLDPRLTKGTFIILNNTHHQFRKYKNRNFPFSPNMFPSCVVQSFGFRDPIFYIADILLKTRECCHGNQISEATDIHKMLVSP